MLKPRNDDNMYLNSKESFMFVALVVVANQSVDLRRTKTVFQCHKDYPAIEPLSGLNGGEERRVK